MSKLSDVRLSKVVLINWMYFQKTTINMDGNTAIVGVNGTGKSTIIDAIQMLLLGNKASKFNANANAEKRTLESYVRGAINVAGKPFLRPGDVVTYLALEITLNDVKHIFGVNLDYKANLGKLSDPKYFYMKGIDLSEDLFIDNNYPKTYDVLLKEFKNSNNFTTFPLLARYQEKLGEILGLKNDKSYFKALSRSVGIKNITDCNMFMNEFVLDESSINVEEIKKITIDMDKVSKIIENEKKKSEKLDEIVETGNRIIECDKRIDLEEAKSLLANLKFKQQKIDKLKSENEELDALVKDYNEIIEQIKEKIEDSKKEKAVFEGCLEQISPDLKSMRLDLDSKEKEIDKAKKTFDILKECCQEELPKVRSLLNYESENKEIKDFYKFIKDGKYTTALVKTKFFSFKREVVKLGYSYNNKLHDIETDYKNTYSDLEKLNKVIDKLANNQRAYSDDLNDFLSYLKAGLKDKFNRDIDVNYFCEYLDITNSEWRNAIEGYLGTQKFYIIVPNECYKEAQKLYNQKKDFFKTKIINGLKLPFFEPKKGTLGEFIISSNTTALNYARYLLNRVHCASDLNDLDNYDIAVTKDCMLYQNYALGRINPRHCTEQFIGLEGIKNQLALQEKSKAILKERLSNLNNQKKEYKTIVDILEREVQFASRIIEDNSYFESIDKCGELIKQINYLKGQISFFESDPKYIEISSKISETIGKIDQQNEDLKNNTDIINEHKVNIKSHLKEIEELNRFCDSHLIELNKKSEDVLSRANEVLESVNVTQNIIDDISKEIKRLDKDRIKHNSDLENYMKNARDSFNINIEPNFEHLNEFKTEKYKIDQTSFEYQAKLVELKQSIRRIFFNQFLNKLYNSIELAKKTIDHLNHSLSSFSFGEDYYKIKVEITQNQDYRTIYNYAKEYNSDDANRGVFMNYEKEGQDSNKVIDLLNLYMFSDDVLNQANIVDYRKYLYFDVEVHTANGIKRLNEVMKTQSGGEVQVPFYILTGVAFQQTLDYKRNPDALGIVLYDEAFDKMDSQRIQEMLNFYRTKLNLQIILASPGRLDSVVDNIQTVNVVVRDGDVASVSDVTHEI